MQTFKGFVLSTFLLLLGIISLGEASAQNHPGQFQVDEQVSRYVSGHTSLALRNILNLNQNANGLRLIKVEVFAMSSSNFTTAQLQINNNNIGPAQYLSWNSSEPIIFQIPVGSRVFGRDINTLKLQLNGSAYIDRVVATLAADAQQGGVQTLRAQPTEDFFDSLPLKQVLNLAGANNPHIGKTIKSVVLKGYPMGQRAVTVKLQIGGRIVGAPQVLDRQGSQQVRFDLGPQDQAIIEANQAIKLIFQGRVKALEVSAEVERAQRQFRLTMNRSLSSGRVFLNQFSELFAIDDHLLFEKIVIRGRKLGANSSLRACAHASAQGAFCESTSGSSTHFELVLQNFPATIADTFVMPRGQVIIDEVILLEEKTAPHQYPF